MGAGILRDQREQSLLLLLAQGVRVEDDGHGRATEERARSKSFLDTQDEVVVVGAHANGACLGLEPPEDRGEGPIRQVALVPVEQICREQRPTLEAA